MILIIHFALSSYYKLDKVPIQDQYNYTYSDYIEIDSFSEADGFTAYYPKDFEGDSIPLIVFNHGWGLHNPVGYGAWIRHLVYQGYAVIFPRYQKSLLTSAKTFTPNAAKGIRDGIYAIKKTAGIQPYQSELLMIGHSYGGVISVNLSIEWKKYNIPKPSAIFVLQSGHGFITSGRIKDYTKIPEDTKMLLLMSEKDHVTGGSFSKEIFELNKDRLKTINLVKMWQDNQGKEEVKAVHEDPVAMDPEFDKGTGFLIVFRAKMIHRLDKADFNGFWKLADGLARCTYYGIDCDVAFGNTKKQKDMGTWKDGTAVKKLKVETPG